MFFAHKKIAASSGETNNKERKREVENLEVRNGHGVRIRGFASKCC